MIKLRKILLCNYLYIFLIILVLIITFIRINIKYTSSYSNNSKELYGYIKEISIDGNKLRMILKGKELVISNYYFKRKSEKDFFLNNIKLGDKLLIKGEFKKPQINTTDGLFNYKDYLKRQKINYIITIDKIYLISSNNNLFYYLKNIVIKKCNNPYIKTFILGDTSSLNSRILNNYRNIGISHLFALSGMHISLFSSILLKLLKKIKVKEKKRYFLVSIILMIYLFLTGISPSILRAIIFFILFSINKIYYFYIKSINIFILTVVLSLLINPWFIYEVSFQYSFSISFFLIYMGDYINKYKNYFIKLFITSVISFVGSIPITLYNFNQINLLSIIYNLFYVPFVSIILFPLSILSFFIPIFSKILLIFTIILESSSSFFNKIEIFKFIFCDINIIFYFIYMILIIICFSYILKNKYIIILFLIIMLFVHYFIPYFSNKDYLIMLDVGQGDSIIIHSNNKTVLIDTGGIKNYSNKKWELQKNNYSIVNSVTIPYLKKLGISKLDYLILTHGDYDHIGEAINLINNYKVNKILINAGEINYLERKIINNFNNIEVAKKDYYFGLGDAEFLQLNGDLDEENDNSLVLFCYINNKTILLTGDASIKSEEYIMKNYNLDKIDILKVGHHGSRTSTSEKFIKKIEPNLALISVGKNNPFNHPHYETISLLKKYNINYLLTSKEGTIEIEL